jgi:hypothetical protein
MSGEESALPAGSVVYCCPLPDCDWMHGETSWDAAALPGDRVLDVAVRQITATEGALAAHLGTHPLLEWVREISRLHGELDRARTAQWRGESGALLLVAILLRRLGGEVFVSDAEQVIEGGTISQMPARDGFRIWVRDRQGAAGEH